MSPVQLCIRIDNSTTIDTAKYSLYALAQVAIGCAFPISPLCCSACLVTRWSTSEGGIAQVVTSDAFIGVLVDGSVCGNITGPGIYFAVYRKAGVVEELQTFESSQLIQLYFSAALFCLLLLITIAQVCSSLFFYPSLLHH